MLTTHPAATDWYFPDTYLPDTSNNISHESLCVLNLSGEDAELTLTLYFEDRDPRKGFAAVCPAMRTRHIRLEKLKDKDGHAIPECLPYAIHVSSSVPILCQYTRVDATKPAYSLMTTMGLK
jgi:hypothetical protein